MSEKNSKRKMPNLMANQLIKHIKRMDNNCYIPDLIQAFSNVDMIATGPSLDKTYCQHTNQKNKTVQILHKDGALKAKYFASEYKNVIFSNDSVLFLQADCFIGF